MKEPSIPFEELATPPPTPNHRRRLNNFSSSGFRTPERNQFRTWEEEEQEGEEYEGLAPIALFQKTPTPPSLTFAETPTVAPFFLLHESGPPPTATEEVDDLEEEEDEEQVFLDPLKMDAGSTPFRRKQKSPRCKRNGSSGGWVKIKTFKTDLVF